MGWAINSVEECYLHTVEVTGSNPVSPTTFIINYLASLFFFFFSPDIFQIIVFSLWRGLGRI
jgi:hypothetical protein